MPDVYTPEHEDFRKTARTFYEREVVPFHEQWEKDGIVPRELWLKAGEAGLLCFDVPEEYDGPGVADFRYNVILSDEQTRAGASGPGFSVHTDIIVPYITSIGTDEQKQRWLPGCVSGETITAIAMTEPGAGSDLQGVRTTAVDKGDHYLLNGSKTFISNGINADLVIVVARTDPEAGHKGISLLVDHQGLGTTELVDVDAVGPDASGLLRVVRDPHPLVDRESPVDHQARAEEEHDREPDHEDGRGALLVSSVGGRAASAASDQSRPHRVLR